MTIKIEKRTNGNGRPVYVAQSAYADKDVLKEAGFWFHSMDRCNYEERYNKHCSACACNVNKAWWTPFADRAARLLEVAEMNADLRAELFRSIRDNEESMITPEQAASLTQQTAPRTSGITQEERNTILKGVQSLASVCDGAHALDGQGFNGVDAGFGHDLARRDYLSNNQTIAAARMIRKYSRQLDETVMIVVKSLIERFGARRNAN